MDTQTTPILVEEEHKLQNTWSVWEHRKSVSGVDYGSNMSKLCTFDTVEGFWRLINHIPFPSQMFTTEEGPRRFGDREIEGISVFKKDIRPEWEDPKNMKGGEFFLRKQMQTAQLDQWWEDLLLGIVGETVDPSDVITGVRIVDKSLKGKILYRLEVWFECNQESDPQLVEAIKDNISQALNATIQLAYRSHSTAVQGGDHEAPPTSNMMRHGSRRNN